MSRHLRTVLYLATVLCISRAGLLRAEPLKEELERLLTENPEIIAQVKAAAAAEQGVYRAYAGYLPKLDVFGQTEPQYIESPVLKSQGGGTWVSIAEVGGAKLTQRLFDGFATPSQLRSARLNVEVAEFTLQGVRQNVLFQGPMRTSKCFDRIVCWRFRAIVNERLCANSISRMNECSAVRVSPSTCCRRSPGYNLAKERRVGFEGGLADAISRYVEVFDHPPQVGTMADPQPPTELLPRDLEGAIKMAREANPAIDSSLSTLEVAKERKRLVRSEYYPTLDLVASANRENNNDLVRGTRTDLSVMLSSSWNLFNGFATTAGVRQAASDYQAAKRNNEIVQRKVEQATRLAWNEWSTARERVDLLENAVAIASEVFEARQKLREAGRETVINVLDAENEVYNARINLTQARGDVLLAVYRTLQGMGRLAPGDLGLQDAQ